jgi:hypothetical protein
MCDFILFEISSVDFHEIGLITYRLTRCELAENLRATYFKRNSTDSPQASPTGVIVARTAATINSGLDILFVLMLVLIAIFTGGTTAVGTDLVVLILAVKTRALAASTAFMVKKKYILRALNLK